MGIIHKLSRGRLLSHKKAEFFHDKPEGIECE